MKLCWSQFGRGVRCSRRRGVRGRRERLPRQACGGSAGAGGNPCGEGQVRRAQNDTPPKRETVKPTRARSCRQSRPAPIPRLPGKRHAAVQRDAVPPRDDHFVPSRTRSTPRPRPCRPCTH